MSEAKKNILLTGATGYLGSNLLKRIHKQYNIFITVRNQSLLYRINEIITDLHVLNIDQLSIEDCIKVSQPEIIIHCATDYGRKNVDTMHILQANLTLPLNLLSLCEKYSIKYFINTDTYLDKGINSYSLSKKQFKDWLEVYSDTMVCMNMALEHFYGPGDDKTKFITNIVHSMINNVENIDLTLGEQKRDFIYIDDVIDAFELVIKSMFSLENGFYDYNVGTSNNISIKDLVLMIKGLTGNTTSNLNFGKIPYRKNEVFETIMDLTKITDLGWKPKTGLNEGLQKTINAELKS